MQDNQADQETDMPMNLSTSRYQFRIYFLVASCFLVALSPARSNARPSDGSQDHVEPGHSTTTQHAEPVRNDPVSAWGPRVLRFGGDLGFLIVPATRWTACLSAAGASALAIYYNSERPLPTTCHPPELDKWQHCYVGCQIASWCPVGSFSASVLAILKEVRDAMGHGNSSWADVLATLAGAWDCAGSRSCEACCCEKLGGIEVESIETGRR